MASEPSPTSDSASETAPQATPAKKSGLASWAKFLLRWGVAIVGIVWVVSGLKIRDRVHVLTYSDAAGGPVILDAALVQATGGDEVVYEDPRTGEKVVADADQLINGPDRETVDVATDSFGVREMPLAGMRLQERPGAEPIVEALYVVVEPKTGLVDEINPGSVAGGFALTTPQPLVEVGLASMVEGAQPLLLIAAVCVFPITIILTSLRWYTLMRPLQIALPMGRAFVLNVVGLFYNTFMLGSTGGDLLKAYYAGKHTPHKGRAWMSVFVDRVIGLLTLVLMGGTAAAIGWAMEDKHTATAEACGNVALLAGGIIAGTIATIVMAMSAPIRRKTGISYVLRRLPMQDKLQSIYDVVDAYLRRPGLVTLSVLLTIPVHGTVIISAMLAGAAFDLPIAPAYYFVAVPVIVLAASVPISPQGAGVMEFFAVLLTRSQGATVSQAFALALSIRAVQILWNLAGGVLVFRGGYSAPKESEIPDDPTARPVAAVPTT